MAGLARVLLGALRQQFSESVSMLMVRLFALLPVRCCISLIIRVSGGTYVDLSIGFLVGIICYDRTLVLGYVRNISLVTNALRFVPPLRSLLSGFTRLLRSLGPALGLRVLTGRLLSWMLALIILPNYGRLL